MKNLGIYVHIPFCKQKCAYCDFCSFCADKKTEEEYFSTLKKEIEKKSNKDFQISSIYFGGGTPSFVDEKHIVQTIEAIKKNFSVSGDAEVTIECNPCSTTKEKLVAYKTAGFNRISFGVQSFDDEVLSLIGRLHNGKQAEEAIMLAKEVGFENISADLMLGLPKQTKEVIEKDIEQLVNLGVSHVSTYMLMLEEGTPLFSKVKSGEVLVSDEDEQVEFYDFVVKKLSTFGFEQYEVSNFAKGKRYSKHNMNYWRRGEYLGFGLSAHSFLSEVRFANSDTFEGYENGCLSQVEKLSNEEIFEEFVMLGLRYFEGVDVKKLQEVDKKKTEKILSCDYFKKGILSIINEKIVLNSRFYAINNEIIANLI